MFLKKVIMQLKIPIKEASKRNIKEHLKEAHYKYIAAIFGGEIRGSLLVTLLRLVCSFKKM